MVGSQGNGSEDQSLRFIPAKGSVISGISKTKPERITEAMADLQLGLDGLRSRSPEIQGGNQWARTQDGNQWARTLGAFARTSALFLRKTVLGDSDKHGTRLLDDRVLESTGLQFDQLRKIPRDKRREIEVGFDITSAQLQVTKLDDHTRDTQKTYFFRAGPQEVKLSIEWPLPGAADWTGVPSQEAPWPVSPEQLFQTGTGSGLSCDQWLGQQVVLFDGKGISLKEMIRTVVNFEAAHSINVGRLATFEGEAASAAAKNPAPHILNSVTLCGIRHAHLIVIECAMYLYDRLLDESSIERPGGEIYRVTPAVSCSPEQAESPHPNWVRYEGGMMISFSGAPKLVRHKIKAVN